MAPTPRLPSIGSPDYMPLLIKSLQSYHAPNRLDSRIFIGMLLALVAGEKNLIIDVDVNELTTQFRHEGGRPLPFAKTLAQDGAGFGHKETLALAEIRVQAMVEYVSVNSLHLAIGWRRLTENHGLQHRSLIPNPVKLLP